MSSLPTGTVSLLFSDIEGSTALLKRLGPAYADALDGQRQVLRQAWADHGGTELGTEGDSFYVVFPTAEAAVAAAAQGQQDLAGFEWPGGEQVRVRMGIHTGSPKAHDGAYVGMDVHRAARIAGAAHGGQVLLSSATSELVTGCLPEQVTVKDLGKHQLKDISAPEHLFQLVSDLLPSDFPPPKTLGTTSSLPRPATSLVGRDGELAELTALLSSPDVRLVTLTGPGGSGKTRLAIGAAERLAARFLDGVYFVPLAAVTTADVMWTSIAEALDVPPEGRIPPGFFDHVAHRSALFVLDNLEQLDGADRVVAEILEHGPQVVVIASSRRPLNVPGEIQHAVPPLELPEEATLTAAERSGAVQMFVQHAKAVKRSFNLSAANAADLVELCQRLDGLPLALELAAARSKLLSPSALLSRLDQALDIAATGSLAVARQKTLRDTIAWSYDLLDPTQQAFFRRLGVFAGGADLDALTAVTADGIGRADPLDLIAELVDASLITISEDDQGEPRVGTLETIRVYALDQLEDAGETEPARLAHAQWYADLAEQLYAQLERSGDELLAMRRRLELENDNFREALRWTLADIASKHEQIDLALRLCAKLFRPWLDSGYYAEARTWLEQAVAAAANAPPSNNLAECHNGLGNIHVYTGVFSLAQNSLSRSVEMFADLSDDHGVARSLGLLAYSQSQLGELTGARANYEEAIRIAQAAGDKRTLSYASFNFASLAIFEGKFEDALEIYHSTRELDEQLGNEQFVWLASHGIAWALCKLGRLEEANQEMRAALPHLLELEDPVNLMALAEDYAGLLNALGEHVLATRLLGAAEAMRERNNVPADPHQAADVAQARAQSEAALTTEDWKREYNAGRNMTVNDALNEAHAATAHKAG